MTPFEFKDESKVATHREDPDDSFADDLSEKSRHSSVATKCLIKLEGDPENRKLKLSIDGTPWDELDEYKYP